MFIFLTEVKAEVLHKIEDEFQKKHMASYLDHNIPDLIRDNLSFIKEVPAAKVKKDLQAGTDGPVLDMKKSIEVIFDQKELSKTMIKKAHSKLKLDHAGQFRDHDVEVYGSMLTPTDHYLVDTEMEKLVEWYQEHKADVHPLELASIFYLKMMLIHPFFNGNGRTARLVFNYILYKGKFPFFKWPYKKRNEYVKVIEDCHIHNEEEPFFDWVYKYYIKNIM